MVSSGIGARAAAARAEFVEFTRGDDSRVLFRCREGAPEWVRDLVYEAHRVDGGEAMLPDDWRYGAIVAALGFLAEHFADGEITRETADDFADGEIDCQTGQLLEWLSSHAARAGYCDASAREYGLDRGAGIIDRVRRGQYGELVEVFFLVVGALERAGG